MVVLDTSALSAVMHRLPEALEHLALRDPGEVVLPVPALAEVCFGLERLPADTRRRQILTHELEIVRVAARMQDWTEAAGRRFGRVKARLEATGRRIDDMDVAIAAIALELGAPVATCNVKHFRRVEGLDVEDWSTG